MMTDQIPPQDTGDKIAQLLQQLSDALGFEFLEDVSQRIHAKPPCEGSDPCICPALQAYMALYTHGWAIVPIEDARAIAATVN